MAEANIAEQIALLERNILEEKMRLEKERTGKLQQSKAVRDNTSRDPVEYQRPFEATTIQTERFPFAPNERIATQEFPDKFTLAENAAASGVDPTTGLRPGLRTSAALLDFDPSAAKAALENGIREDLGPDFPAHEMVMAMDPASGMPAYMRRQEDGSTRWTLINPPGIDVGDVLEFGGELPTLAADITGSIAGGIAAASVSGGVGVAFGAATAAGILASASIPLRVWMARKAGIPDSIIDQIDISDAAAWQGMLSFGGELLGHTIIGSFTNLRNFYGRGLDLDDIPALEAEIKKRLKIIAKAEEAGGVKFQPSLGQLTGNTDVQLAEASLMGEASGATALSIRKANVNNDKATAEAMKNMATQEVRSPGSAGFRTLEDVSKSVSEKAVKQPIQGVKSTAADELDEVAFFNEAYAKASDKGKYKLLRAESQAQYEAMHDAQAAAWKLHRRTIEWNPDPKVRAANIVLDNSGQTPIRTFMTQLEGDSGNALMSSLATAQKATLKSAGFGPDDLARMAKGGEPTGLAGMTLDTRHLHTTISHLKRIGRQMDNGVNTHGFERADVSGLIDAIEEQMKKGTFRRLSSGRQVNPGKAENIRSAWKNANDITSDFHTMFDSKAMRQLLKTKVRLVNGERKTKFDLPPGFIGKRLFKKQDARFLSEAMDSVGQDPRVRQGLAEELMKRLRRESIVDGRVQQGKFNNFMDDFEDHFNILVGPEEFAKITNLGTAGRVIDTMEKNVTSIEKMLKVRFGKVVGDSTSPFNISDEILGPNMDSLMVSNLMKDLRHLDPRLAQQVEEKVLEGMYNAASKADRKIIDFVGLDDLLRDKRDTLKAVAGKQYVRDLDTLRDGLEVLADKRFSKAVKTVLQGPYQRATRLLFGPLGRQQRFISAFGRAARNTRAGTVRQLLEDPTTLRRFVKLKNMSPRDPRFWLGAQLLGDDILDVFAFVAPEMYSKFLDGTLDQRVRDERNRDPLGL